MTETAASATNSKTVAAPQKKFFRQRAHSNPLADHDFQYPLRPSEMNWNPFYPAYYEEDGTFKTEEKRRVEVLDIGCGYGGLLVSLSKLYPDMLSLGMEIRVKVSAYVNQRILSLRSQGEQSMDYQNIAIIRTNAMKYLTNFFEKGQLKKLFFLFPDPQFKRRKNKWRIISGELLSEYAYLLQEGGIVYTITDVLELNKWMHTSLASHPLFEEIPKEEYEKDPVIPLLSDSSEEGKKVTRNNGQKYLAVFRRIKDPHTI